MHRCLQLRKERMELKEATLSGQKKINSGGLFDTAKAGLMGRMGYMDYCQVTPENTFSLNRPKVSDDGRDASLQPGSWDGEYT